MSIQYIKLTKEQMNKAVERATSNAKYWAKWNVPPAPELCVDKCDEQQTENTYKDCEIMNKNKKPITIHVEKIILFDGLKQIKVNEIRSKSLSELPDEYINSGLRVLPYTTAENNKPALLIKQDDPSQINLMLVEGKYYDPERFYSLYLPLIRQAGKRLNQINRKLRNQWEGYVTFEI